VTLTVACVFVKGNVPYSIEYVTNLRAMVAKHLPRAHSFVCLTDRPWLVPRGIDSIPVQSPSPLPGWWSKVRLHDPELVRGDRVLYLDLDTIVVGDLRDIVDYPASFALVPHAGTFEGKGPLRVVKRFNSSVMVWDRGASERVFAKFAPDVTKRLFGDQDFVGETYPNAAQMPPAWFPRLSDLTVNEPGPDARVVLCKKPKNSIAADLYPWVAQAWRAA
jgi:hypothetical protein